MSKGMFISFEGSEGSGKSTQIRLITNFLKKSGRDVVLLREPGSTKIGESIRRILLNVQNKGMADECEMLLYMAARAQLVEQEILPALKQGKIVLCDRFLDSTLVYQGYGHGMDLNLIRKVGRFATQGVMPDLTFIFDIDAGKGLSRIQRAKDRIELRNLAYHNRVRTGYQELAKKESRIQLIEVASQSKEEIHSIIRKRVEKFLK